jgi:DNA topoisomerase I
MKLVIVESPAKAKTIEKYLGKEYKVAASVGHIRDLPKSNKKAISIEDGYVPHYEISRGKDAVLEKLQGLVGKADEVILATDPDREGEAIAWHLKEALKLKKPARVTFNEITKQAVLDAMEHPRVIDENLRKAQEARRVLDRLVGYDLSGVIWKKVRYGLSAGRVQSPALRILAEREREIRAFKAEPFVVLEADILKNSIKTAAPTTFTYHKEIFDIASVSEIIEVCESKQWTILDVKSTPTKREPRPPFTTSSLQQAASNRYGFSPSRTMGVAQKLYESGHITYMRTDSPNLSTTAIGAAASYIKSNFGDTYHQSRNFSSNS